MYLIHSYSHNVQLDLIINNIPDLNILSAVILYTRFHFFISPSLTSCLSLWCCNFNLGPLKCQPSLSILAADLGKFQQPFLAVAEQEGFHLEVPSFHSRAFWAAGQPEPLRNFFHSPQGLLQIISLHHKCLSPAFLQVIQKYGLFPPDSQFSALNFSLTSITGMS